MGGDGAYANWLDAHFSHNISPNGCVDVQRLVYAGASGTDVQIRRSMAPSFRARLNQYFDRPQLSQTRTIILNWHIRYTGRPNAWTGRGSNQALIQGLRNIVEGRGYRLIVLYTVHESEGLQSEWRHRPSLLMALNPDVQGTLSNGATERVGLSRVPGLMTCAHTTSVDLILQYLGGESNAMVRTSAAVLIQQFRLRTIPCMERNQMTRQMRGIVVFGMITPRHGLSGELVSHLCKRIAMYGFGSDFRLVIAGKTQDGDLAGQLNALEIRRLHFHGELDHKDGFTTLAGCKYAISFDPLGFRDNASAQVNVIRAGHLLFSRRSGESNATLVERALVEIVRCERDPEYLTSMLIEQSSCFMHTSPDVVGNELDRYLRDLASGNGQ